MKNPAAVALGKLGGKAKSPAKAKTSAENGKKGGRPRKTPAVPVKGERKVEKDEYCD